MIPYLFSSIVNGKQYSTKVDYLKGIFPEKFNQSSKLEWDYIYTPNLRRITKTGENEVTVFLESEKPVTKSNLNMIQYLNEYWEIDGTIDNNKIIYIKISDRNIPNGNVETLRLGGYPSLQASNGFNTICWYPNEEGQKMIDAYFEVMTSTIDAGETFNPIETIETIGVNFGYGYDETLHLIMTYIYIITMV